MQLTRNEIDALSAIVNGADVYDRALAGELRQVEKDHPELISIGKPQMYRGNGTDRMPYFGAICTDAGVAAIAKATGETR